MRFRRFAIAATAVAGVLAGTVATVGGVLAEDTADVIDWRECEDDAAAECGVYSVPIDWSGDHGETVDLALARVPATDPDNRVGALFVNPGGPGGSGVDFALSDSPSITAEMRARFDIIGIDPRGVEGSHAVECDQDLAAEAVAAQYPDSDAEYAAMTSANAAYGESCAAQTGPLFQQLDNVDVVRDFDAVRQALGEERMYYYGTSYGTLIGQQYAEMFPRNLGAMVLDSNMDHTLSLEEYQATATRAQEDHFAEFVAWCDAEAQCAVNESGAVDTWDRLYAQAAEGELDDPADPDVALRPEDLGETLLASSYSPADWWAFADYLAALDSRDSRAAVAAREKLPPNPLARGAFEDAYRSLLCQDWDYELAGQQDLDRWHEELEELAPHTKFNTFTWSDVTGCQNWPAPTGNPTAEPEYTDDLAPVLFFNSQYDAITPHAWGSAAAERMPNASLVTYEGSGHGAVGVSECANGYADDYLVNGTVPEEGTTCEAEPVPEA